MEMILFNQFTKVYFHYFQELWWILAFGFLLSGIFYKFIPTSMVEKYLGKKGFRSIFTAAIIGTIIPVCCIGSLPIALTLKRKGASLGSVLAFLVATPATSISALIVCWKLLGFSFAGIIFVSVILMAILMGFISNDIHVETKDVPEEKNVSKSCCSKKGKSSVAVVSYREQILDVLKYAFITLPKAMGLEILLGIAIASFITVFDPVGNIIQQYLTGLVGYFVVIIVGLLTYVCSTASVPMADALLQSGMSHGQALSYLLVGPITSYGTILVIRKDFGGHVLALYLGVICIFSLTAGIVFDLLILP